MSMENIGGAASRGPSRAAIEKAVQFKSDMESAKERLLNRRSEIKTEMADILEKEKIGKAMLGKITDKEKKGQLAEIARQQETEWGRQLGMLREELTDIERSMREKNIGPDSADQALN